MAIIYDKTFEFTLPSVVLNLFWLAAHFAYKKKIFGTPLAQNI